MVPIHLLSKFLSGLCSDVESLDLKTRSSQLPVVSLCRSPVFFGNHPDSVPNSTTKEAELVYVFSGVPHTKTNRCLAHANRVTPRGMDSKTPQRHGGPRIWITYKPGKGVCKGNPSPPDVEAEQKGNQGHFWLHSKFQVILGYMTPIFKTNKQTKQKTSLDYFQCLTWYKCCVKSTVRNHLRCNVPEKSIHRQHRSDIF